MSAPGEAADSRPTQNEVNKPNYTISALLQVIKLFPVWATERERKSVEKKREGKICMGLFMLHFNTLLDVLTSIRGTIKLRSSLGLMSCNMYSKIYAPPVPAPHHGIIALFSSSRYATCFLLFNYGFMVLVIRRKHNRKKAQAVAEICSYCSLIGRTTIDEQPTLSLSLFNQHLHF